MIQKNNTGPYLSGLRPVCTALESRVESAHQERLALEQRLAEAKADASSKLAGPGGSKSLCLICKEQVPRASFAEHCRGCLLALVNFTASRACQTQQAQPHPQVRVRVQLIGHARNDM